jgi:hypothetical protein
MGAPDQANSPRARRVTLTDTLDRLDRLRGLKADVLTAVGMEELLDGARATHDALDEAQRELIELVSAYEMLLVMLDASQEEPLRADGLKHLMRPLVGKLHDLAFSINEAIH